MTVKQKVTVSMIKLGTSIHFGSFGPIWAKFGPKFDPILVHCHWCRLKYFDICTDSGDYFQKHTLNLSLELLLSQLAVLAKSGPNLVQFLPNLVHLKTCKDQHQVRGALEVLMTPKRVLSLKILSL